MASLRKRNGRKPLISNGRLFMSASSEGANGFTLYIHGDEGIPFHYAVSLTAEEAAHFVRFHAEMAERRLKSGNVAA